MISAWSDASNTALTRCAASGGVVVEDQRAGITAKTDAERLDQLEIQLDARFGARPAIPAAPLYTETDLAQAFYGRILANRLEAAADDALLQRVGESLSRPARLPVSATVRLKALSANPPATLRSRLLTLLRSRSDRAQLLRSVIPWAALLEPVELATAQAQSRLLTEAAGGCVPRQAF